MFGSWFAQHRARASFAAGAAALDRGDCDLALSHFTSAVREHPHFALGYLGRGLVHLRKGAFDAAIADLSEAIRLGAGARGYYLRALGYAGTGDNHRERADRREALRLDPNVGRALNDPAARHNRLNVYGGAA